MTSKMKQHEAFLKDSSIMSEMHIPEKGGSIHSFHQNGKQKTTWYLSSWEQMKSDRGTEKETVTYHSKIYPFHGLHRTLLTIVTPRIKAKEGIRISFCENLFVNMIKEYRLQFNETELQSGNTLSLLTQLRTSEKWCAIGVEIGNSEGNQIPRNELEPIHLAISIPWSYSLDKSDYFPLQLCGSQDNLLHIIKYNLNLSDLVLMYNEDKQIPFDMDFIESHEEMMIPEMEGLYTTLTQEECKYNICLGEDSRPPEYYVRNTHYLEDDNEVLYGKKVPLKFGLKITQPILRIDWGALNVKETERDKNPVIEVAYKSPIYTSSLESAGGTVFRDKGSFKTERAYHLLSSKNYYKGLSTWENNVLLQEDKRKFTPGVNMKGGKLTVNLVKSVPECEDRKFIVFGILHYISRFKFSSYPKSQEERLKVGAILEEIEN
jgi:hypothetical protein